MAGNSPRSLGSLPYGVAWSEFYQSLLVVVYEGGDEYKVSIKYLAVKKTKTKNIHK